MKTISRLPFNLSPKLVITVSTFALTWVVTHYGIDLDPDVCAAIATALAGLLGYSVPPATTVVTADEIRDLHDAELP